MSHLIQNSLKLKQVVKEFWIWLTGLMQYLYKPAKLLRNVQCSQLTIY